jgi:hypothetical protein
MSPKVSKFFIARISGKIAVNMASLFVNLGYDNVDGEIDKGKDLPVIEAFLKRWDLNTR